MCAELIAIGPYSDDIAEHLEHSPEYYQHTREGARVARVLFAEPRAGQTGLSDAWDSNQHQLEPSAFDRDGLLEFGERFPDYRADVAALLALASAGFAFHFLPNG